jgi:peptide/nickel transport system ATP-binding protein
MNPSMPLATGPTAVASAKNWLLDIRDLVTHLRSEEGTVPAVDGVSFILQRAETLGIVGESGSGKSMTAYSILRLVPPAILGKSGGSIHFNSARLPNGSVDLASLDPTGREIRKIRGREIGMIFQEPMSALSPVHTIGNQVSEAIRLHERSSWAEAKERTIDLFRKVRLPNPERQMTAYPHELSGGMRQRVMIAIALSCNPSLLIADEPTTALDVTVQAQILDLLEELKAELGMAILFITHDLGVVARIADRVAVMYLGKIVETSDVDTLFHDPRHPYSRALLQSIPRLGMKGRLQSIHGSIPDAGTRLPGCAFINRCPEAHERCRVEPPLFETGTGHQTACWLESAGIQNNRTPVPPS